MYYPLHRKPAFVMVKIVNSISKIKHMITNALKAAYSVTMNIFRKKKFLFKSFVKVE